MGVSKYKKSQKEGNSAHFGSTAPNYTDPSVTGPVDYSRLSDLDFVRNLDRMTGEYYFDYVRGRGMITGGVDSFTSDTSTESCVGMATPKNPPRLQKFTGYFYRRSALLVLMIVLSIAELVLFFFSLVFGGRSMNVDNVSTNSIYLALIGRETAASSFFVPGAKEYVPALLFVMFSLLYPIASVMTFIVACKALAARRQPSGVFTYHRFDRFCLMRFVSYAVGLFISRFIFSIPFNTSFLLLAILGIVVFVCGIFVYKKATIAVPENLLSPDGHLPEGVSFEQFLEENR